MAEEDVKIKVKIKDEGTKTLEKLAKGAEKVGGRFDELAHKVTELGAIFGVAAGAFSFEKAIDTGKEYLEQISRLSKLTGTSAQSVASMRDVFEKSGVSAEQLSATMSTLSKKSAMLQEGGGALVKQAQQWGVDMKHGPEKTLISISKLVKEHKIGVGQVSQLTRSSGENLGAMMNVLEKGPEELGNAIDEARKKNKYLNEDSMDAFERYKQASVSIHQSWTRLSAKIVTTLAPVLEKLSDKLSGWMDKMGDGAGKFANALVKGLEMALTHAKLLGHILLANSLLMRFSGGSTGLGGGVMRAARFAGGAGFRLAGRGVGLLSSGLASGTAAMGMGGAISQLGGAIGPIGSIVGMLLKLVGGATGIGLVVTGVILVMKNFDKIKERFASVAEKIWTSVKHLWEAVSNLFSEDNAIGRFFTKVVGGFGSLIGSWIEGIAKGVELAAKFVEFIQDGVEYLTTSKSMNTILNDRHKKRMSDADAAYAPYLNGGSKNAQLRKLLHGKGAATDEDRKFYREWKEANDKYAAAGGSVYGSDLITSNPVYDAAAKKYGAKAATEGSQAGIYQDFRGSRFDIKQAFSEGFDPDRIGVAFANELGSLGERKLQSGFSPLFGVR